MVKNEGNFIIIKEKARNNKLLVWVFFGILGFLAIFVPFFGTNLRYQTGTFLKMVMNTSGTWCLVIGGFLAVFGFIGIFMRTNKWMEWLIVGGLLIWIGCWLTGIPFSFESFFSPGETGGTGGGYH